MSDSANPAVAITLEVVLLLSLFLFANWLLGTGSIEEEILEEPVSWYEATSTRFV
jgi:hypothetical protein